MIEIYPDYIKLTVFVGIELPNIDILAFYDSAEDLRVDHAVLILIQKIVILLTILIFIDDIYLDHAVLVRIDSDRIDHAVLVEIKWHSNVIFKPNEF